MNILFIANKLNIHGGGSNRSLDLLARSLCDRGHDVEIATVNIRTPNSLASDTPYSVVSKYDDPQPRSTYAIVREVLDILSSYEEWADVVHSFFTPFNPMCGFFRRRHDRPPVVGRLNTYLMFCTNPSRMQDGCWHNCTSLNKFAHANGSVASKVANVPLYLSRTHVVPRLSDHVDKFFAISPSVKQIHVDNGLDGDSIDVIPNFADPLYQADVQMDDSPFGDCDDGLTLLYVGRVVSEKGPDLLVDAVERIDDPISLHIAGDGPLRAELTQRVQRAGLEDVVTFHGNVAYERLPEYYSNADLFVHPGRWPEPFGRTVLEAMQHQCPVLASNVGGPPWIAGESGMYFENGCVDDLENRLTEVIADPGLLAEHAARTEEEVKRFEKDRVVQSIEDNYYALYDAT